MYQFARDDTFDVEEFRTRLRKWSDEELIRYGKACRSMCGRRDPRPDSFIQLEECKAEWRRRHPKPDASTVRVPSTVEQGSEPAKS